MSIIAESKEDVFVLSLNRPEAENRLAPATLDELTAHFANADPLNGGPAVIVLSALGPDSRLAGNGRREVSLQIRMTS